MFFFLKLKKLLETWAIFMVSMALVSCASVNQKLDSELFYKRDIQLDINGISYSGVTVIPSQESYDITITPPGNLDLAIFDSCHRSYTIEKADSGWKPFGGKKKFTYKYIPVKGIEDTRVCPLRISTFDSSKGLHAWSFLDFESDTYKLPFKLQCDGAESDFMGVGVCQAKSPTVQRVKFNEPVMFAPIQPGCSVPERKGGAYEIQTAVGECLYSFTSRDGLVGRFTLIGFSGVLVRASQ